jgi:hypothetical protein
VTTAPLFAVLRNMSLSRDQNAPINLTPDDWAEFDKRQDATALREAMAEAREQDNQGFFGTLNSRIKHLRHPWKSLKLADNRRKYFEEADRSRAQGEQPPRDSGNTSNHASGIRSRKSNAQMANQIFQHVLRKWNASNEDGDLGRYVHLLVAYLRQGTTAKLDTWGEEDEGAEDNREEEGEHDKLDDKKSGCDEDETEKGNTRPGTNVRDDRGFVCVICVLRYKSRSTLTGHYEKHRRAGLSDQPLQCPECRRNRENASVEKGYLTWLNHLERFHGQWYTPYFQQTEKYSEKYPCPFSSCDVQRKG